MKILLAGQNGIIGSFLYDELKSENEITGIGKGKFNSLNYTNLDLLNRERVNEFIRENDIFDVLIFLVGLAHTKGLIR
jgi:nucleoside-diphosphate-sugar epimerase